MLWLGSECYGLVPIKGPDLLAVMQKADKHKVSFSDLLFTIVVFLSLQKQKSLTLLKHKWKICVTPLTKYG